jgi:MYXO-CTERM domain-containing protein
MRTEHYVSWLVASLILFVAGKAHAQDPLPRIDAAFTRGQISQEQRIVYRLAALRDPSSLPASFRSKEPPSLSTRCHAPIAIEAYQAIPALSHARAAQVRSLLSPPPEPPYSIAVSEPYPIKVSYTDPAHADKADQVMKAAILAFEKQVTEFGFLAPPIDPAHGAYRMYVASAQGAAGYTSPYGPIADTPHSDAYSFIVIDPVLTGLGLDTTVTHEFAHACQVSMDAQEIVAFMENSATYIEGQVYPSSAAYVAATFPYFQRHPHRPLEYMKMFNSDLYEYGGSLFVTFLQDTYGDRDPRFLREIWERTMQEGFINEPDYFDALEVMLEDRGGMREAAIAFAESRFFVGSDDDGKHMTDAGSWYGAEVSRTATWSLNQLPLIDKGPPDKSSRPGPNGCNYVVLRTGDTPPPLHFTFQGEVGFDWWISLIGLAADGSLKRYGPSLDNNAFAELELSRVDQESSHSLLAIFCQLAPPSYDPDDRAWTGAAYTYSFDYAFASPTILSIDPPEIARGSHNVSLTLRGTGFADCDGLDVAIGGSGAKLWLEEIISPQELRLTAAVPPTAPLGPRDITVTNPGGKSVVGPGLLSIVDLPPQPEPAPEPRGPDADPADESAAGGGCACTTPSHPNSKPWFLAIAALALIGLRRRA